MKIFHELFSFFLPAILGLSIDNPSGGGGAGDGGAGSAAGGQGAAGTDTGAAAGGTGTGGTGGSAAAGAGGGAAQAGATSPLIGADGKFLPGWSKLLGGTDALEAKFTDPKALVGSYQSLEKLISAKGIIPPGPNATPEQKAEFFKALGRPDKPEDYGISKAPEKLGDKPFPKELWDQERATGFSKVAHDIGLTKAQAEALAAFDMTTGQARFEKFNAMQTKAISDAEGALKTEWGPKYAENLALAQKAAKEAGGDALLAHPLANDPMFIKAMAKVGSMIVEAPAAGARGTQHQSVNPASEIDAIMNDKQHAWQPDFAKHGHSPKAHEAAVQRMAQLYRLKNGEAA